MTKSHLVTLPQRLLRQRQRRADVKPPPLVRLLGAGRGAAEVRLRTYLWLWASLSTRSYANPVLLREPSEWAVLTGILEPADRAHQQRLEAASRRVRRAMEYLSRERLIERGSVAETELLDPDGSGRPYRSWDAAQEIELGWQRAELRRFYGDRTDYRRSERVWEDPPLKVPSELWRNGTVSALPAASLVVLLVLWDLETGPDDLIEMRKTRAHEYPVTHASWQKGTSDLLARGILTRHPGQTIFGTTRPADTGRPVRARSNWTINRDALALG